MLSSHPLKPIRSPAPIDHPPPAPAGPPPTPHIAEWDATRRRELRLIARVYAVAQARRLRVEARLRVRLHAHLDPCVDRHVEGHPPNAAGVSAPDGVGLTEDGATPRLTAAVLAAALRRTGTAHDPPRGEVAAQIAAAVGESALLGLMRDSYLRCLEDERALRSALVNVARAHPVWPWVSRVPGVSAGLVARLLARLDLDSAPGPSSFARYCGLGTEPPASPTAGFPAGPNRRRAQLRPARGESARYDREAKRVCHFLALRLLRADGAYAAIYRGVLARRLAQRPEEPAARHGVAARRAMQQAFLYHLWACWRHAAGLDAPRPYAEARLGLRALPDHWQMTDDAVRPHASNR